MVFDRGWWWLQWQGKQRTLSHMEFMVSHVSEATPWAWERMGFPKALYPSPSALPSKRTKVPIWPKIPIDKLKNNT